MNALKTLLRWRHLPAQAGALLTFALLPLWYRVTIYAPPPFGLPNEMYLSRFLLLYPLLFIQTPEKRTLPLALLDFQGEFLTNYPLLFTGVIVASTPLVIAYVFLQRYFVAGLTAGSVRG